MSNHRNIEVFQTADHLDDAVAKFIIHKAAEAVRAKGRFVIAISGGNTPQRLFALLAQVPYSNQVRWDSFFVFWADERCVPLDDERNNAHMAQELWLSKVPIPPSNTYKIPSGLEPEKAARIYEDNLRFFFRGHFPSFDLILLGLGENGHTASLFPYTDSLRAASHLITTVYVAEQDMHRVTMTSFLINMATDIVFMVSGAGKAEIVNTVINGEIDTDRYPAQLIAPHTGSLYWFLDADAASML